MAVFFRPSRRFKGRNQNKFWSSGFSIIVGSSTLTFSQTGIISASISGTSSLTFAQNGCLQLYGNSSLTFAVSGYLQLYASSTVSFGSSSNLYGQTMVVGSSSIAFGTSGLVKGVGVLSGSSTLVFNNSSTLIDIAPHASTSITFAASATLYGIFNIAGSNGIVFNSLAYLQLSGAANLSLVVSSATVSGTGAFTGSASTTFNSSSVLLGSGSVVGTSSIAFDSQLAIRYISVFAFSVSGTISATGILAGFITGAFAVSSTLVGSSSLVGSSPLAIGSSSTIVGRTSISSSAALTFTQTGLIKGDGVLLGSNSLSFVATSILAGLSSLHASSTISTSASAIVVGTTALVASQSLTFNILSATMTGDGRVFGTSNLVFANNTTIRADAVIPPGSSSIAFSQRNPMVLRGDAFLIATSGLNFVVSGYPRMSGSASFTFYETGHILGSAVIPPGSTDLEFETSATVHSLIVSNKLRRPKVRVHAMEPDFVSSRPSYPNGFIVRPKKRH